MQQHTFWESVMSLKVPGKIFFLLVGVSTQFDFSKELCLSAPIFLQVLSHVVHPSTPEVYVPILPVNMPITTTRIISPMTATIIILMDMPWAFFLIILLFLRSMIFKSLEE